MDKMMKRRTQEEVGTQPGFLVVDSVVVCLSCLKGKVPKDTFIVDTLARGRVVSMDDEKT
jgi:hypothetical protein